MNVRTFILILVSLFGFSNIALAEDIDQMGDGLRVGHEIRMVPFSWNEMYSSREAGLYGLHRIRVIEGFHYVIETAFEGGTPGTEPVGSSHDTYLYLGRLVEEVFASEDPSWGSPEKKIVFKKISQDDDGGKAYNARIEFEALETETLHVLLRAYGKGQAGSCRLSVRACSAAGDSLVKKPNLFVGEPGVYTFKASLKKEGGKEVLDFSRILVNDGGHFEVVSIDDGLQQRDYQKIYRADGAYYLVDKGMPWYGLHWPLQFNALSILVGDEAGLVAWQYGSTFGVLDSFEPFGEGTCGFDPADPVYEKEKLLARLSGYGCISSVTRSFDVTGLPDGDYKIIVLVNPYGGFDESIKTDNWRTIHIAIGDFSPWLPGREVKVLSK